MEPYFYGKGRLLFVTDSKQGYSVNTLKIDINYTGIILNMKEFLIAFITSLQKSDLFSNILILVMNYSPTNSSYRYYTTVAAK